MAEPQRNPANDATEHPPSADPREALLACLLRGASAMLACAEVGVSLSEFLAWLDDPAFRERLQQSQGLLSRNVAAALYRSALKGSVTAQTFYLKNLPPPEWPDGHRPASGEPYADLTDDELLERCRALGIDLPPAGMGGVEPQGDSAHAEPLP